MGGSGSGNAPALKLFAANDGSKGSVLWKTDSTSDSTRVIKDINAGSAGPFLGSDFVEFNGASYFKANDVVHGSELWKADGTTEGTVLVKDINPSQGGAGPAQLTTFNDILFFTADDGVHGDELWKTDGTANGTILVKNINTISRSSPSNFFALNGALIFQTSNSTNGPGLWKTDGTETGTQLLKPFCGEQCGVSTPAKVGLIRLPNTGHATRYDAIGAAIACAGTGASSRRDLAESALRSRQHRRLHDRQSHRRDMDSKPHLGWHLAAGVELCK